MEKLRIALEESPSTENIERFTDAQEALRSRRRVRRRGGGAEVGRRRRAPSRPPGSAPGRAVGRRAAPSRARAHPVRRERAAAARRTDQSPRRRCQELAAEVPAVVPRRAARREPRPRPARRSDHTRRAHRPRIRRRHRHARRVQGHLHPVSRGAGSARSTRLEARRPPDARDRPAQGRRPARCAGRRRSVPASPRTSTGVVARLESTRVQTSAKRKALAVRFPAPPTAGRTVLTATELWKSFGALDVFADVSFDVGRGERLLVMGLNGAGKTTLLKVLADVLESRSRRGHARFARLGRLLRAGARGHRARSIAARAHARVLDLGDGAMRNLLGMFGLSGEKVFQDANTLSGGEKTKLALAQLVAGSHNVLLLDEPTNNLDPSSRTATGEALAAWPGTMIVVSHDVDFVRSLAPGSRADDAGRHARLLRRRHAGPARAGVAPAARGYVAAHDRHRRVRLPG